jgi:hypothetical protein
MAVRTKAAPVAQETPAQARPAHPRPARSRVPTNLSLPAELVAQVDEIAGPRGRSAWIEEVVRRAVRRERFYRVGRSLAGSLKAEDYPHWRTSEDVVAWVREMRAEETDTGEDAP